MRFGRNLTRSTRAKRLYALPSKLREQCSDADANAFRSEIARTRGRRMADTVAPLLIPDRAAAELLGISRAHLHRLRAAGKFPDAIRLGRALRFDRAELVAWADARCPDVATWRAMRAAGR